MHEACRLVLNLHGSESNSDNPRSKSKLRWILRGGVPRSVSNYRRFPECTDRIHCWLMHSKRHSRRRAEDLWAMNGWTFGIELRLTRSYVEMTLSLSLFLLLPCLLSFSLEWDSTWLSGDEISHYSRLNGVNQGLVEFRRGIGGSLSDRWCREDEG